MRLGLVGDISFISLSFHLVITWSIIELLTEILFYSFSVKLCLLCVSLCSKLGQPERFALSIARSHDGQSPMVVTPLATGSPKSGMPSSFLVNPEGQIVRSWTGMINRAMLESTVTPLLNSRG